MISAGYICQSQIQRIGRGMLGRQRAAARRSMIAAATRALDWVSLEKLQPKHLKELAHAIHGALVDPVVSKFTHPNMAYTVGLNLKHTRIARSVIQHK